MGIVNVTGVGPVNFPEGMSDRDIIRAIEFDILPNARPAAPTQAAPPPSTSGSSLLRGIDELQGSVYSAIEGGGNITGIGALQRFGREGRIRNEQEAQQSLPDSQRMTFEQAQGVGQNVRAAGQALGMSLPSMAPGLAGAATGAALGSVVPGIGTVVGGVLGGAAASLPLFFGTNRQRQLQANPDQPVNESRAALTAIPQALSEGVVDRVSFGLGRVLGIGADVVARNVIPRILRGIGVGAATEVPTEVFQQVLERAQAGLDILDSEAMAEYREAAIASAVVGGGIGGGFAALPGRNPPAGPRTREEDEALRGAIDTVTGERDYLDETQGAFDEVERQREARDRANRFPDIRNVDPEIYAAENPIIAANMAAELIDIRDRKVRSDGKLGLPGLVEETKAARSDLAMAEQAASAAGVAPQDDPTYQSAKARYDDLNEQISVLQNRIAYLSARVDPRIAAAGPIAELTQAQQNLKSLQDAQKDANKRLEKAKKSPTVDLGNLESIQAERADLLKKVHDQQREILKLQRLIPENQRQITARENKKGFARPAFEIAGAKEERRKADAEATDLRAGAAPFAEDILLINPQYNDEGKLENGEVVTRLDAPADDGSVVAYVNRLIDGKEQEVAVPANVNDILRIKRRNAGVSERETDRTKQAPSARLTQEAVEASFGPEEILGGRLGAAVDPNQMDLNPRRVTDRVGGQNTGTASPEPDYVAPSAPAPAPKAPSTKGVLPEGGDQQQTSTIVPPSEQVSSFNMPLGKVFTIMTPDASMKVNVVAEIVDLKSLVAAYGEFQNRETENVANKATIARIANNPKFELLTTSPYSDRGTPVVGPDNMVEAGNHRVKGLKGAAESNPEGFAGYVQSLRNAGYAIPDGISYPVLIRRRVSELTHDERVRFCDLSNKEASQSFTAQETAEGDAKLIDNELMNLLKGDLTDGILAAGNAKFVRKFLEKVLTTNEYNEAVSDKGGISDALETRITNALFFYAYKNKNLLSRLTNRRDDKTTKKIISGLASATGAMHTLRQGIEGFNIRPEFDIIGKLVEATDRIRTAITGLDTADGRKEAIKNIFNTKDLVTDITPLDLAAVRIFLNEEKDGIASAGKIAERLKDYVDRAETQTPTKDLVGGEKRITPEEALTEALKPGETALFSSRNAPGRQDVEAEAESRERKSPPEVEQALALIKARLDSLRAKGSQGAALAKALEDTLANRKLDANQIYAAFTIEEALLKTMPKGANYEFQFLHDIVMSDKDVAEKAGVKLGTKLQGMKVAPAREGLPGLIQISLTDDMLPILNETTLHEAFHVLQDYFAAYDKGYKAAIDKHFKDGMKVADFEPSIKRRLQAMKPPGSEKSYWDLLVEAFKDENTKEDTEIKHGYEAQAYAFGALADAAMRGEKVVGLLPPFQRFFNFLRDTMAALRSGFVGDGFRTPASLLGRAGERAAKYNQQAPRTAGQFYSARQINTSEFQRWFGDSKVVDANGNPMSVFHGTPTGGFDSFDTNKAGRNIDSGYLGTGFYFTDGTNIANYYAASGAQESPAVYPVYLSIKNPFMWGKKTQGVRGLSMRGANLPGDLTEAVLKRAGVERDRLGENYEPYNDPFLESDLSRALREELIARGYDGVIAGENTGPKEYVVFRPEQIKSAIGNSGAFDPNDSRIQFSARNVQKDLFTPTAKSSTKAANDAYLENESKNMKAQIVYKNDDVGLMDAYGIISGPNGPYESQYYIGVDLNNGRTTGRVDIENYKGAIFSPEQISLLIKKKKEHLEKQARIALANPRGPFKGQSNIAFDPSFSKDLRGFTEGLVRELGLDDVPIFFTDLKGAGNPGFASRNSLYGEPYNKFRYLSTKSDARLYGTAYVINTITNQGGVNVNISTVSAVAVDTSRTKSAQIEAIAHEIGHIFDNVVLQKASPQEKQAIRNAFNQWMGKKGSLPAHEYIAALRSASIGRKISRKAKEKNPNFNAQNLGVYLKSFDEWFADQVGKWGTTSVPGQSLIARFFRRIAMAYKKIVSALGKDGLPDQTVADFIENHRKMRNTVSIFSAPPLPGPGAKKPTQTTFQFLSEVNSLKDREEPQFSARKAPGKTRKDGDGSGVPLIAARDWRGKPAFHLPVETVVDPKRAGQIDLLPGGHVRKFLSSGNNFGLDQNDREAIRRHIEAEIEPKPNGVFWRMTNNKNEPKLATSGQLKPSRNHTEGFDEKGVSVADSPHYIMAGYSHGYPVSGQVIGSGSDGEPLLDPSTIKVLGKIKTTDQIQAEQAPIYQAARNSALAQLGWTPEHYRAAINHMVGMSTEDFERHRASAGPLVLAKNPVYADKADYQFSARKAPPKPTTTSPQARSLNAAGNAQAFYNSVVKRVDTPNVFDSVLAYMFDKKPGEKISAAIARTSVNAAAPLHAFHAMASKDGYTGLSAGRALELQMSNSGRINQILNAGMGKLNAKTGEITLRNDVKPLLQIMDEADVGNDATKKGWLQTYLVALRERDLRKVNRRVFTDTEDQRIADTIREIEAKYPQFKQTAADLDKMNKALIEFALEAGLITKQHAGVLSSKFYTPAYREDVDQISNALNVQLGGGVKAINDLYSNIILNADSIMKASLKNLAMRTAAETMKFANVGRENTTGTKSDNTISYRSNGKKVDFDVDDPVLFSALTSMPRETINGIYQAMASTASFFRDLITVAPSFIFKNLYAGKISAYVQEGAPLLNNTFGGVRDALKNTTTLQNFQMQTGFGGMEWGMKPKDMVKTFERKLTDKGMMEAISRGSVFSALRQGFTKLQALSEASEMAERIKLSESLIKKGMSPRDAYFQAYLIAPYSRKGTGAGWLGHTVHFMAPLVPFLNAKLQTTYRLFENEKGSKTILGLPKEIFLRGLVLTVFSTAAYALNLADDEEEWDGRPNYMKLNYDIIPFTSGLVTLPRAYEIGKIFGALPVFALDAIRRNEGSDLTEALLQVAVSTLWINPIPKAIEPIIGAVTNYDFFRKQPYESAGEQGLPIQERVRRSTTSIARGVSAGFNSVFGDSLSPIQAQAVLEGYSGTIGTMIMAGFDSLLSAAGAIPSKPAGAFGDPLSMPAIIASTVGFDTFYRDPNSLTSRFVNDFYRVKEMTDQLVRSRTLATNARDYERLQELRGEEGLPLRMRPAVNAASTRIADINKRIRLIERGNLGSLEKTEAIQPLIAQRDQIARRVVDQARNLGIL